MDSDGISVTITGLDVVQNRMRELPAQLQKRGVQTALRKAANKLKRAIEANARAFDDPATPNSIAKNIYVQANNRHFRRTGDIMMRVGVLGGGQSKAENESNKGGDTWYWKFKEHGYTEWRSGRPQPAKPFIRPAVHATQSTMLSTFSAELSKEIDKQINKLRFK